MFIIDLKYIKQQKSVKYLVLNTKIFKILYEKLIKTKNN